MKGKTRRRDTSTAVKYAGLENRTETESMPPVGLCALVAERRIPQHYGLDDCVRTGGGRSSVFGRMILHHVHFTLLFACK